MAKETYTARESGVNPINAQRSSSTRDGHIELTRFLMNKRDLDSYGANQGFELESGNYRATVVDTGMGKRGWQVMDMWVAGGSTRETGPEELFTYEGAQRTIRRKFSEWRDRGIK